MSLLSSSSTSSLFTAVNNVIVFSYTSTSSSTSSQHVINVVVYTSILSLSLLTAVNTVSLFLHVYVIVNIITACHQCCRLHINTVINVDFTSNSHLRRHQCHHCDIINAVTVSDIAVFTCLISQLISYVSLMSSLFLLHSRGCCLLHSC